MLNREFTVSEPDRARTGDIMYIATDEGWVSLMVAIDPLSRHSSMSRKGNSWGNAFSDTLFGSLKVERLHGQRCKTRCEAKNEAAAWLLWHNRIRLHSTLAYIGPIQFEQDWLASQPRQANS